ncbi:hypothetical protein ACQEVF_48825 [Nonomuraea polychroma]
MTASSPPRLAAALSALSALPGSPSTSGALSSAPAGHGQRCTPRLET